MAQTGISVHELIAERLGPVASGSVIDLGCGTGSTLATVAGLWHPRRLIGIDAKQSSIDAAGRNLIGFEPDLRMADLEQPLDLPDDSVDAVICHNVLECLADPITLINEVSRILAPGGRAVWSHTDFDTIVINTTDVELSRRVLQAYADLTQPWMAHSDPRIGRKLPGLIRRSQLVMLELDTHVVATSDMTPLATDRINNIAAALAGDHTRGRDVARWRHEVDEASEAGDFMFAELTFVVTSSAPER